MRLLQSLSRAGDGVAFSVNQPLDIQHHFDVATPIEPLASTAFVGF